jgi:anti-sigma regulatory factor (Ser/Thr protein kinase)
VAARPGSQREIAHDALPYDGMPLPAAPATAEEFRFDLSRLADGRHLVARRALMAGLSAPRTNDLVLAVNEILTNSIRHGGGAGVLRIWQDDGMLICEVKDGGRIDDPLAGRRLPDPDSAGGRGLWMANHLCDLVQIRSPASGNVVRLHMRRVAAGRAGF